MQKSIQWAVLAAVASVAAIGCKSTSDRRDNVREAVVVDDAKPVQPTASVHVAAGDLALSQQKPDEALRQYQKALELNPSDDVAMFKLATLYAYGRRFDESVAMWQKYLAATGESAAGQSNLGRTYELVGRWREAEACYVAALRKEPTNATARVNYGIMLAKRERIDEAELQLSKALPPAEVQYNLGSVFEIRRDMTSARERYMKAIAIDPTLVAAQQRLDLLRGDTVSAAQ